MEEKVTVNEMQTLYCVHRYIRRSPREFIFLAYEKFPGRFGKNQHLGAVQEGIICLGLLCLSFPSGEIYSRGSACPHISRSCHSASWCSFGKLDTPERAMSTSHKQDYTGCWPRGRLKESVKEIWKSSLCQAHVRYQTETLRESSEIVLLLIVVCCDIPRAGNTFVIWVNEALDEWMENTPLYPNQGLSHYVTVS
jgi:hypothetical protein